MTNNQGLQSLSFSSPWINELWKTVENIKTKNSAIINTELLNDVQDYLRECRDLELNDNQQKKIAHRLRELEKLHKAQIQLEDSARINKRLQELSDDVRSRPVDIVDVASDLHLCFLAILDRDLACVTDKFRASLKTNKNLNKSLLYELLSAPLNDILTLINQEQLALYNYDYQNIFLALKHLSQKSDDEISTDLLYPVYQNFKNLEREVYHFQPGELINLLVKHNNVDFLPVEQLRKLCRLIRSPISCNFDEFKKQMELNFSDGREQDIFRKLFAVYCRKFAEYDTEDEHVSNTVKLFPKLLTNKTTVTQQIFLEEPTNAVDVVDKDSSEAIDSLINKLVIDTEQKAAESLQYTSIMMSTNINKGQATLTILGTSPFNESLGFSKHVAVPRNPNPFIVHADAENGHQVAFLIDGIDSPHNVLEFKPDANEPSLFIVRLKQAEATKPQNVSERIASSLKPSLIFKTSQDSLTLSVAYGRILLQGFPARNIGELKQRINDLKRSNCIQLRPASMEKFNRLTLIKIIESVVRSVCYMRSTNCDMDSIYEICSQNEYDRDTIAFEELVRSLFVSNHCANLLSGILPDIIVQSELLKKDVLPYKLTMEANVHCLNVDSMPSIECVYRSVKALPLGAHDLQKDSTIELHVRLFNEDEQTLRDACDMASELTKPKESFTTPALDQDRYFTWN